MPTYVVTDPASGRKVKLTGDTPPTDADLDDIFASLPPASAAPRGEIVAGNFPDVPNIAGINKPAAAVQQPSPSIGQRATALGETALAMGTGATTGTLGMLAGTLQQGGRELLSGQFGTPEAANRIEQRAADVGASATYSPRSPLAGNYLSSISDAAAPLAGLAGLTGQMNAVGNAARMAPRAVPDALEAARPLQSPAKQEIAQRIIAGGTEKDLAKSMVPPESIAKGRPIVKSDRAAKEAIKQGFDEGLVSAVKQTTPTNKSKLYRMADIAEKGFNDARFKAENRPIYVAGDSLSKRLETFKKINQEAGQEIERAAEKIQGKPVNYAPALQKFESDINDFGISIDENGRLNFSGSDLEFSSGDKKLISNIYSRARKVDGSDAYEVHRLKRLVDRTVDYGKGSSKGITRDGEAVVKSFRAAADEALDNTFSDYNAANTKYADSIRAINNFQDAAGSSVDIFGVNAEKGLGNVSRRLLSNAPSMANLYTSLGEMDKVAGKYGAKFDDDILTQVMFADALDKKFGAAASTSLQGDVGKGVKRGLETAAGQRTLSGIGIDAASAAVEKARGINEKNAFKSIKDLLAREAKK